MGLLDRLRGQGREPDRATLLARGVAFLVALAAAVGTLGLYGAGRFSDDLTAVVLVDDAGGSLVEGADVKYAGVVVGRVTSLRVADDPARGTAVDISLPETSAAALPGNLLARVLPASVFGTSFVDLVPDGPPWGELRSGQAIQQDRRRSTLEVQDVLDGLDRVVDALGPAELAAALDALAGALDGNGERLGRTVERLEAYLGRLNPSMGLVRENLRLLATNLEAFEGYAPDLFAATEDVLVAARTLAEGEDDFRALVRSGSATLRGADRLLDENEQALVDTLVRTAVLVDVLYDGRAQVAAGLRETFVLGRRFGDAVGFGPYLRIDADLVLDHGPGYTREDCPSFGGHPGRGC